MRRKKVKPWCEVLFLNLPAGHSSRYDALLCDAMPKKAPAGQQHWRADYHDFLKHFQFSCKGRLATNAGMLDIAVA